MARTTKNTGGVAFSGKQYTEFLATRQSAMKGNAEGTVSDEDRNAARAQVRNARKAITRTGMTVKDWREAEEVRQAPKPRAPKVTQDA